MTIILQIPIAKYNAIKDKDPEVLGLASNELWDELSLTPSPGLDETKAFYRWAHPRLFDADALEELSEIFAAIEAQEETFEVAETEESKAEARQRLNTAARIADRVALRKEERAAARIEERTLRRVERRKTARALYRTASRVAERKDKNDIWPDWGDADEETQNLYMLEASNKLGDPDVKFI
jgi:hypothetical protein